MTGVQTCALPISTTSAQRFRDIMPRTKCQWDIKPPVKRPWTKCHRQNAAGNKAMVTRPLSKYQWLLCRWGHNARPDKMPQPIIPLPIVPYGSKCRIFFIIPHLVRCSGLSCSPTFLLVLNGFVKKFGDNRKFLKINNACLANSLYCANFS